MLVFPRRSPFHGLVPHLHGVMRVIVSNNGGHVCTSPPRGSLCCMIIVPLFLSLQPV